MSVLWGLAADLAIFHSPPSALSLLGAAVVCSSSFGVVSFERRAAEAPSPAQQHGSHGAGGSASTPPEYELVGGARTPLLAPWADEAGGAASQAADAADDHTPLVLTPRA